MTTIEPALAHRIEAALGRAVRSAQALAGGSTVPVLGVELADGTRVVVKAGRAPLALEAWMIGELRRQSQLPLPQVLHAEDDLLVLEWLPHDPGPPDIRAERHLAALLAALHAVRGPAFGYARDTTIGQLAQPNPWTASWIGFYRDARLLAMSRPALAEGAIDLDLARRIERLGERLDLWLLEPTAPALLHGDVWTGNVLHRDGRVVGLIDPSIHFGHPEVELSYATMFGTIGTPFLERYAALVQGHDPAFVEIRAAIYRIYPLLVHVRYWDRRYAERIAATLDRLGL
jgi:fructosamine-3-kinase